jgi:mannitol-specific phosphotransferase system IIBC component
MVKITQQVSNLEILFPYLLMEPVLQLEHHLVLADFVAAYESMNIRVAVPHGFGWVQILMVKPILSILEILFPYLLMEPVLHVALLEAAHESMNIRLA